MATKEDQETLRRLVQHVSRGLYESRFTIILDQLARHPVLKEDDLASKMGLQPKELNKLIATLAKDRLVHVYRQNELKEGAQRSVGKQYYFIDYQDFCNVVKWRIAKMRHIIDSTLRNELDNKGYICLQCDQSYQPLDVPKLIDASGERFICEICNGEVVDNENAESVRGSQDRMERFNHQMRFIRTGLQKSESMVLPAFDVATWVKNHPPDADKAKALQAGGELRVAGSGPGMKEDDGVGVMMSMDKDEATRRSERDAEAAAKRQQNALPTWHLKSTITDDLTALGVKEHARAAAASAAAVGTSSSSNDDILRGLGLVGGKQDIMGTTEVEDVKPIIHHEPDYYDQYYASLAASSSVASSQATPSGFGASVSDDFGDFDEEEDKKPSIEYLDSLNAYRKRSRSKDDEGDVATKIAKVSDSGYGQTLEEAGAVPEYQDFTVSDSAELPAEDPIVYVNGVAMAFSKVSEEDQEQMTPEEYTAYFEVYQAAEAML